ncbi:MAG: DUF5666 domain-containing protein [Verrucomicrobiota bacterium]
MKAKLLRKLMVLGLTLTLLPGASLVTAEAGSPTSAPTPAPAKATAKALEFTGTISMVDAEERTVKVDKFLMDKTFNLAEKCTFAIGLDKESSLDNLTPDMEVTVRYQEADGVLVATHIAQRWYTHTGYIKAATPASREIVMERMGMAKKYKVNDNTRLTIHNDTAKLGDLKPGQKVTITYTKQGDIWLAQKVEDTSETFNGTVEAIDAGSNTIKVKSLVNTRKFNLGEGCKIVLNGETNGKLKDLRIGQKVTIDYEEVKGVMVAARIELDAAHTAASNRNAVVQQSQ